MSATKSTDSAVNRSATQQDAQRVREAQGVGSSDDAVQDAVQRGRAAVNFNDKARDRRERAAVDETARAEAEGRLPASSAITNPPPATAADMTAGGAFIEPAIREAIPVEHPAVENNPRAGTSAVMNGQDFNEPFGRDPLDPGFAGHGLDLSVYGKRAV